MPKKTTDLLLDQTPFQIIEEKVEGEDKPDLVDLRGLETGMAATWGKTIGAEAEDHIKQILETKKGGKAPKSSWASTPDTEAVEEQFEKKRQKIQKKQKPRNNQIEQVNTETATEDLVNKTKTEPIRNKKIEDNREIISKKTENGDERTERLEEMIDFVDEYRRYQIKSAREENNKIKKAEINERIKVAEYRIEVLKNVLNSFLYPSKENELTREEEEEAIEVREIVKRKMAERRNVSPSPEEKIRRAGKLHEILLYLDNRRNFLIDQLKKAKKFGDRKEIEDLQEKIEGTEERIEILDKARIYFLDPINHKNALPADEWVIVEQFRDDVLKRMNTDKKETKSTEIKIEKHKLTNEEKIEALKEAMSKVETFDQYIEALKTVEDGIQGPHDYHLQFDLIGRAYLVACKELELNRLPTLANIRSTMSEKILPTLNINSESNPTVQNTQNTQLETQQAEIPTPEEVAEIDMNEILPKEGRPKVMLNEEETIIPSKEEGEGTEDLEKKDKLRIEVKRIFGEKITEILSKIEESRALYGKQIKLNIQHELAQTRIGSLVAGWWPTAFNKKTNSNKAEYDRTESEYHANINELQNILNDENLNRECLEKIQELGFQGLQEGLKVITEEKASIFQNLVQTVLIKERTKISELKGEGLPERDRRLVDDLVKRAKNKNKSFIAEMSGVINVNPEENAQ
jgi:hypothetical protein